jgi:hypothetical protein
MRIFKVKWFNRWSLKEGLADEALKAIVSEIEEGLIDADLGGYLYKKRVAIESQGKSGGRRTILTFKAGKNIFFLFGFSKSERDNISAKELKVLKRTAKELLSYNEKQIKQAVTADSLIEVK